MTSRLADNIRVVMVETSHPGNIGAAARAMKATGFANLYLVRPGFYPHAQATARAAGAADILDRAVVCDSFAQALQGCVTVAATSARPRRVGPSVYAPREYIPALLENVRQGPVALVFGRESSGLSNAELDYCNVILEIPTQSGFNSLNVASAVQILCYEFSSVLRPAFDEKLPKRLIRPATVEEMAYFYEHLQQVMIATGFLQPQHPKKLMRRLKTLFNRAGLDENELSILRGFLTAVQESINKGD